MQLPGSPYGSKVPEHNVYVYIYICTYAYACMYMYMGWFCVHMCMHVYVYIYVFWSLYTANPHNGFGNRWLILFVHFNPWVQGTNKPSAPFTRRLNPPGDEVARRLKGLMVPIPIPLRGYSGRFCSCGPDAIADLWRLWPS